MPIQLPAALGKALICVPWQCAMLSCPEGLPGVSAGGFLSLLHACFFAPTLVLEPQGRWVAALPLQRSLKINKEVSGAPRSLCWFF